VRTGTLLRNRHDAEILRLGVPALGALIAEPLYVLADTAVVGHLGTDSLAGLAIASSALLVGYSIFIFLAYATTAAVSRLLGADDHAGAAHQAVQSLWLAALIGLVLVAAGLALAEPLVTALGGRGRVATEALTYLRISLLGVPAMLVVLAGTGYLRGLQDTRTPLVVALVSATANLVIEVVLIAGLGYGIGASALSTVVAQVGSALVYVLLIHRAVAHHAVALRPHWPTIGRLGIVGRDLFLRTVALRSAHVLTTAAAARISTVALAAHTIAFEIWNLLALVLDAVAIAGQAMIGRFLGAGDAAEARAAGRRMLQWGVGLGIVVGVALLPLHGVLPDVFTDDAEVAALAAALLVVVALVQPLNGLVFVLDGLLIGAGDMGWLAKGMAISLAGYLPVIIAVVHLDLGIGWLWAGLCLFMSLRAITLGIRWRHGGWAVVGATHPGR
jgi:putative MATE family efflux protein